MAVIEIEVSQFIAFFQGDTSNNPRGASASNTIKFTQKAKNYSQSITTDQAIHFGQQVNVRKSINHISVSDFFAVSHSGNKSAGPQSITQYLILGSAAKVVEYETLTDTLDVTQSVLVHKTKSAINTIVFTHAATYTVIRAIEVVQTFIVHSHGTGYIEDDQRYYSIPLPTLNGPNAPEYTP